MGRGRWWPVALAATAVACAAAYVLLRSTNRRDGGANGQAPTQRTRTVQTPQRPASEANRRRKIATVGANNVILNATATGAFAVIKDAIDRLLVLATMYDIYIIAQCDSDEAEANITDALEREGVFKADIDKRKLLFCSTSVGKAHMARQLEPHLHIDGDTQSVTMLQPHVPMIIHVAESVASRAPANTQVAQSLASADLSRL
eukprot:Opistho-2@70266